MNIYLDTNIIISYHDSADVMHNSCQLILNHPSMTFYTGIITIIEFEAVIQRKMLASQIQFEESILKELKKVPKNKRIEIITRICFNQIPIIIMPVSCLEKWMFNKKEYLVENTYPITYKLIPQTPLRTLDSIQIASALKILHYEGINIQYFLTNDQNILNHRSIIHTSTNILPISSSDLCNLLKI